MNLNIFVIPETLPPDRCWRLAWPGRQSLRCCHSSSACSWAETCAPDSPYQTSCGPSLLQYSFWCNRWPEIQFVFIYILFTHSVTRSASARRRGGDRFNSPRPEASPCFWDICHLKLPSCIFELYVLCFLQYVFNLTYVEMFYALRIYLELKLQMHTQHTQKRWEVFCSDKMTQFSWCYRQIF